MNYNIYANNANCSLVKFHVYATDEDQPTSDDLFLVAENVCDEFEAIAEFCRTLNPKDQHDLKLIECAKKYWGYKLD